MPFSTLSVASATAPTVISTFFSHYLNSKAVHGTPSAQISYHEGLNIVRKFLEYASHHTVEELQAFTRQPVPYPIWIRVEDVTIPSECIDEAAEVIVKQLGPRVVEEKVGGKLWWRWRAKELEAEWVEMKRDYKYRCANPDAPIRTMFYVHGGAYFFGSVNVHRYQLQRHARKLKGRVFAPCYRLSPQFPFPCALLDVLASYFFLLKQQPPSTVVLAGDSAGGGLILSLLAVLRDNDLPLPAGAVLISPWVDLCHSFPSITQDDQEDFIPRHGFLSKPSAAWPPPNADDLEATHRGEPPSKHSTAQNTKEEAKGFTEESTAIPVVDPKPQNFSSVVIDGTLVTVKDQIHMYATNALIGHPLVSPCNQGSLGGLPPLLVIAGGGEVLRDEQIYIAHKAANPAKYPPHPDYLEEDPRQKEAVTKYPPTKVRLQVYDHCCHVTPTLSFTKPARLMYRSIANFSEFVLSGGGGLLDSHTKPTGELDPTAGPSKNDFSPEDSTSSSSSPSSMSSREGKESPPKRGKITKKFTPPPPFHNHMIRERIDLHGNIYDLTAEKELPGCQLKPEEVGVLKPEPVRRWMEGKTQWDVKFAKAKRAVQKQRAKELAEGYIVEWEGERPPPSAACGRRIKKEVLPKETKSTLGMRFWEMMAHSHDQTEITKQSVAESSKAKAKEQSVQA